MLPIKTVLQGLEKMITKKEQGRDYKLSEAKHSNSTTNIFGKSQNHVRSPDDT